jgi:asparagine synthetase B (glutamine-hydrolysing)
MAPNLLGARASQENVMNLFTGEAADELFGGEPPPPCARC